MTETIEGYWFAESDELPNGDGRKVVIGETLSVEPPIGLCRRGLHASRQPFDALNYAPGPLLYKVRLSGEILEGEDKCCATSRTALAVIDSNPVLRLFARKQALSVIHLWSCPAVVRECLERGDEKLRNEALSAARAARSASASNASASAARAATYAVARMTPWTSAAAVASSSARAAAWATSRALFNQMIMEQM